MAAGLAAQDLNLHCKAARTLRPFQQVARMHARVSDVFRL